MSGNERETYLMRLNISLDLDDKTERLVAEYHSRLPDGIKVNFFKLLILEAMDVSPDEIDLKFGRLVRAYGNKNLSKGRGRGRKRFDMRAFQKNSKEVGIEQTAVAAESKALAGKPADSAVIEKKSSTTDTVATSMAGLAGGAGW